MKAYIIAAVVLLALGGLLDRCTPIIGANARIAAVKAERDAWKVKEADARKTAAGWERSYRKSEGLRTTEGQQAATALTEAGKACEARIATARKSAQAIAAIVTKEPKRDPQGCPVRQLVDPRELRDALAPR